MDGIWNETQETAKNGEECMICRTEDNNAPEVPVSLFDYSLENHFKALDTIYRLCGEEADTHAVPQSEIERLSSTIIFLRLVLLD